MAPVHCAAGSDGETNFGVTSLAAPKAASSSVARYSLTARLAVSGSRLKLPPFSPRGAGNGALFVGVPYDQARIDRKPFGADKACRNARLHDALEDAAENIAVAKPFVARPRKGGVIGDPVLDPQAAEPSVCQVYLHLTADRSLRADRECVAENEHPKHQYRIDRRTADR